MSTFSQYLPKGKRTSAKSSVLKKKKSKGKSFITATAPVTKKPVTSSPKIRNSGGGPKEVLDSIDIETCDINYIDEQIIKKLQSKISTLPEMQKDLQDLMWIINYSPDAIDQIHAKSETSILRRRIQDIEGGFDLGLYILRTSDILNEYRDIMAQTRHNNFVRVVNTRDEVKIHRRNQLILEYLRIAKDYVNLENFKPKPQKTVCENCHSSNLVPGEDDSILTCKECGNIVELLDDAPTFKDSERVNMSSRYTYTCRGHFIEAMNRFEGKQNTDVAPEVIDKLKSEMALHGLDETTATKDHIYMFLSENKLSDQYSEINLLFYLITKVNPPDITEYRNELLDMHDELEEAYSKIKESDRLNSLNVNWKLYKLLQLLDYNCKKDDFFCLKTPTKQGEHEQKWHEMIEYLSAKYPSAVTSYGKKRWRHTRTI